MGSGKTGSAGTAGPCPAPILAAAILATSLACGPVPSGYDPTPISPAEDPVQERIEHPRNLQFSKGGYDFVLTPLARYTLRGVVVGRENYYSGWNSLLAPCDVAVAWGELLQGDLYRRLDWSQSNRWYYWEHGDDFPRDERFVARYSSNTHLIPADENLTRAARSLGAGDLVELSGELVKVDGRKGDFTCWWTSSTSREDTGDGSCEVLYLRRLRVEDKVYE